MTRTATTTTVYTHPACLQHDPGPHHPESPARLHAVLQALKVPDFDALQWQEAPAGTVQQVLLVHTPGYVDEVQAASPRQG